MRVRMIFATPVDRQDWLVGEVYEADGDLLRGLLQSGRAEPAGAAAPVKVEAPAPEPVVEAPRPRKGRK